MAELDFIVYRGDQAPSASLGNEECSRRAVVSLVYDDDGARGDFGRIQTVILNPNKVYEYVRLKYNSNFDVSTGGEVTLDGISLIEGDRVYLAGQNISGENAIYEVETGAWTYIKPYNTDIVFIDLGARATDAVDGDLTRSIITYKPDLDLTEVGFYTINYYVVNSIGILSRTYRKVKVLSDASASIMPTNSFKITNYEVNSGFDSDMLR